MNDLSNHRVLTYDAYSGTLTKINTFWGDRLLASYAAGQVYFQHSDVTGTVRATTNSSGSLAGTFSSMPFGDRYTPTGMDIDPEHFSELDRDGTSQTEHAQFRQYSSALAQWMSPDPYSGSYDPGNPQSFNRYAYALNNPLVFKDRLGLEENSCDADEEDPDCGGPGDGGVNSGGGGGDGGQCLESQGCYIVSTNLPTTPAPTPPPDPIVCLGCESIVSIWSTSGVAIGGGGTGSVAPNNGPPTLTSCAIQALGQNGNGKALALDIASGALTIAFPAAPLVALTQSLLASASAFNTMNHDGPLTANNYASVSGSLAGASISAATPSIKFFASSSSSLLKTLGRAGGALSAISAVNDFVNYAGDVRACLHP